MPRVIVKTDHKWKPLLDASAVPAKVLRQQFDYMTRRYLETEAQFVRWRGYYYDLRSFVRLPLESELVRKDWHGIHGEGVSSGMVIALRDDEYKIGAYRVVAD